MIEIIGTSHISPESVEKVRKEIKTGKYSLVAVELDRARLRGMKAEKNTVSYTSPFAVLMSRVQKFLSKKTGITPGSEMLEAVKSAEDKKIPVSLIDQDISVTIKKMKKVSKLEKIKMIGYVITGLMFPKKIDINLESVPDTEMVKGILKRFEIAFPQSYNALIEERNELMTKKLSFLEKEYGNVLAVVGAGHVPGLKEKVSSR